MNYEEYRFDSIPSTQDFLREQRQIRKASQNRSAVLAVAKMQTGGKGTKGRSFESGLGGLWFSALEFHENTPTKDAFLMMARSAVAVCKTIEEYGLSPQIKWANDVLLQGKKVCGVLTENVFKGDEIDSTLFGIGLNVNNQLGEALQPIATTLSREAGQELSLADVEARLMRHFFAPFEFSEYAKRLAYLGKEIAFLVDGREFTARLMGVTNVGQLILLENGAEKHYAYGEIALRKPCALQGEQTTGNF